MFRSLIHFDFIFVYGVRKCSSFILLLPGSSTGDATHDKGHEEEAWQAKASQISMGPLPEHLPQNQNLFTICYSTLLWH